MNVDGLWSSCLSSIPWESSWKGPVSGPVAHLLAVALPSMLAVDALENRGRCRLGNLDTIEPTPAMGSERKNRVVKSGKTNHVDSGLINP